MITIALPPPTGSVSGENRIASALIGPLTPLASDAIIGTVLVLFLVLPSTAPNRGVVDSGMSRCDPANQTD